MPLIAHHPLPSFARLRAEGEDVLDPQRAQSQDIRELHIGLLNLMPDAAFEATERQFLRWISACTKVVQAYVHPFSLAGIPRSEATAQHIARFYEPISDIFAHGLDALIITGANVSEPTLDAMPIWDGLVDVVEFAARHVTSTLCACMATHAVLQHLYGLARQRQPNKVWGVFEHRPISAHPLVRGVNTRFDVPHSRYHDIPAAQLEAADVPVLLASDTAGAHLAVSGDGLRFVFLQGHPEYDRDSLQKEYKREVLRYLAGERPDYPPAPQRYFDAEGEAMLVDLRRRVEADPRSERWRQEWPEALLVARTDNTWGDSARTVANNWLGLVYQLTGFGRHDPLMAGVDPQRPLGDAWR